MCQQMCQFYDGQCALSFTAYVEIAAFILRVCAEKMVKRGSRIVQELNRKRFIGNHLS